MTQNKIRKIHRFYGWFLAAVLAAIGILFILSCLDIYRSGPRPYHVEAIALRFRKIAVPVIVGLVGVIGGIILNLFLPLENKRAKGHSHDRNLMLRFRQKVTVPPVQKEVRLRFMLRIVTALCFVGLMIYPLIYFLTPGHFSVTEINSDVIRAVLTAFIPAMIGLVLCWICQTMVNNSFRRETDIYKKALAEGKHAQQEQLAKSPRCHCSAITAVRGILVIIAVLFIGVGILNGGADDVLKKAIAICTECIGLG